MTNSRLLWGVTLGLALLYAIGFVLGWAGLASWHLLLVIVAIMLVYSALSSRR